MDTDSRPEHSRPEDATRADATAADSAPNDISPVGGDETTEDQLEADNPAEEATVAALDPDDSPA